MIAAIYARKSTTEEDKKADPEAKSVHLQIANAKKFAADRGWTVDDHHIYFDDAVSGADTYRLVNRQRMIDLTTTGRAPFQVLIIRDESRFSRAAPIQALVDLTGITSRGVDIWCYGSRQQFTYDDDDIGSEIKGFVTVATNAHYRRQIARNVKEALTRKAERGHVAGGEAYGYTNERMPDGHVERRINPDEAKVVQRIFDLTAHGAGAHRIAKTLNADGVAAPDSHVRRPRKKTQTSGWGPSSVRNILLRTTYIGHVIYNQTGSVDIGGGRFKTVRKPQSEWIERINPDVRIVSDATWKAAHARIDANRRLFRRPERGTTLTQHRDYDSKYLLVGFSRCECGAGFHVRKMAGTRPRYSCTRAYKKGTCAHTYRWDMDGLNEAVVDAIQLQLTPDRIAKLMAHVRAEYDKRQGADPSDQLKAELEKVDAKIGRLADAIENGGGTVSLLTERLKAADLHRQQLAADLDAASRTSGPTVPWSDVERTVRGNLSQWKKQLLAKTDDLRDWFRHAVTGPIVCKPVVVDGRPELHFEGRFGLAGLFGGVVTNDYSRTRSGN